MKYGLHDSEVELEDKVHKRKVVDLGPIMLDAERCVLEDDAACRRHTEPPGGLDPIEPWRVRLLVGGEAPGATRHEWLCFSGIPSLAAVSPSKSNSIITTGEWIGAKHERHL